MIRAISLMGMAGGFLLISPKFRYSIVDVYSQAVDQIQVHSPISYVLLGVGALAGLMLYMHKTSQPR